jgi:hypothetical protein
VRLRRRLPWGVDAAGRRSGQEDKVWCAGIEPPFEGVGGAGALRVGILETTILQHAERARTEGPSGAQEQAAEGEDESPMTHDEPGQSGEHEGRVRHRTPISHPGDP